MFLTDFSSIDRELYELEDEKVGSFQRVFRDRHSGAMFFNLKVIWRSLKVISRSFFMFLIVFSSIEREL